MIGTHDSGTGEACRRWWHGLLLPFARTQTKTLSEQFDAGARVFDLRVRWVNGVLFLAHGLWESSMTLQEALHTLSNKAEIANEKVYVMVTYEGDVLSESVFRSSVRDLVDYESPLLTLTTINVKLPKWRCIEIIHPVKMEQGFVSLEWFSWRCLLPIPYLWWLVTRRKKASEEDVVLLVDFL